MTMMLTITGMLQKPGRQPASNAINPQSLPDIRDSPPKQIYDGSCATCIENREFHIDLKG